MSRSLALLPCLPTLLLAGCVFSIGGDSWDGPSASALESRDQAHDLRHDNRQRMRELQTGMSAEDVDRVMGSGSVWVNDAIGHVDNPFKTEGWIDTDGQPITVRFYYTSLRKRDNIIADDELTPVVFKSGQVVGWGDSFFERRGWQRN